MSRRSVRDVWHAEVLCTPLVRDACRVLLLHLATGSFEGRPLMTETGYVRNVRHEDLARPLGVDPKRVTDRLAEARKAGLLVRVGGGHNGQATQYRAEPQGVRKAPKVPAEPVPTPARPSLARLVKVPANGGPSESPEPVPTRGSGAGVGTGRTGTIRARTTDQGRERRPAPDGSREEPSRRLASVGIDRSAVHDSAALDARPGVASSQTAGARRGAAW